MIPYLGDTIGKPIKAARNGKKILKLRKEIAELIQIIEKLSPAGRKASAKTKDAVAEEMKQVLKPKKSPQYDQRIRKRAVADTKGYETTYGKNAQTKFRKHNTETFKGTLRGEKIELRGVSSQPVSYTKRSRNEYKQLRSQFDTSERKNFVQNISSDPDKVKKLKEAGLTDINIKLLEEGKIPKGWQVHHKLPLDDGGTNNFDNLVLIKNDPYHVTITNAQHEFTKGMTVGDTKIINWPIPSGFVYPPKP